MTNASVALRLIASLALAVLAQNLVARSPYLIDGVILYAAAIALFVRTLERVKDRRSSSPTDAGVTKLGDAALAPTAPVGRVETAQPLGFRGTGWLGPRLVGAGLTVVLAVLAWLAFGGNQFTATNLILWLGSVAVFLATFWERPNLPHPSRPPSADSPASPSGRGEPGAILQRESWSVPLTLPTLALCAIVLMAAFFLFYRLDATPGEMTSDHSEKLLDVHDVLNGARPVFFPRNTGREGFQFYLAAATVELLDLPLGFMALKLGTAAFGLLAIPFVYLLGKELAGRLVGLIAAGLASVSLWHVAISRMGLRYPFTAAFSAAALYFLLRAFRQNRRNDWLLCGLITGIGLHTYSPIRVLPLLLVALVALKLASDLAASRGARSAPPVEGTAGESTSLDRRFWANAAVAACLAVLVFLPLGRYAVDHPQAFWHRALTRSTDLEREIAGNPLAIFLDNNKNALLMLNFRGDVSWVTSIPGEPAADTVSAALFALGLPYVMWRSVRRGDRVSLYLLAMLFVLLLPSTSSIAFPSENPSLVRAGGAIPVVFIIAALPLAAAVQRLHGVMEAAPRLAAYRAWIVGGLVALVVVSAARLNYDWYFVRYDVSYRAHMSNAGEMAAVVRGFASSFGDLKHAYLVTYPHWVDHRHIGIMAGDITWGNLVTREDARRLTGDSAPKLFLVHRDDQESLAVLERTFPTGAARRHTSQVPGKDFVVFVVPGR